MNYKSRSGSVYYEVQGPEKAPALIFTHGGGLNGRMFAEQVAAFKDRYRVITWDMLGHGRSSPLEQNLDVKEMAACIKGIMEEEKVEKAVVIGHSVGGYVVQYAGIHYPERIQGIVSIGALSVAKLMNRMELRLYQLALFLSRALPGSLIFRRAAGEKTTTSEARQFFYRSMVEMGKKQFLYMLGGQLDICQEKAEKAPPQPLLITHGEKEMPRSLIKANKEWHAAVPGSSYSEIPGAGHNASMDNPDYFNRTLLSFVEKLEL